MENTFCIVREGEGCFGKKKVFFSCTKQDYDTYFESISNMILDYWDCAIHCKSNPDGRWEQDPWNRNPYELDDYLSQMQLIVVPFTISLVSYPPTVARFLEVSTALHNNIPVLGLVLDSGLEEYIKLYSERNTGKITFLDWTAFNENTDLSHYEEELESFLASAFPNEKICKLNEDSEDYVDPEVLVEAHRETKEEGLFLLYLQYYDKAEESFLKLLDIDNTLLAQEKNFELTIILRDPYLYLGIVKFRMGNFVKAKEWTSQCITILDNLVDKKVYSEMEPSVCDGYGLAYENMGDICAACNDFDQAMEYYEFAIELLNRFLKEISFSDSTARNLVRIYDKCVNILNSIGEGVAAGHYEQEAKNLINLLPEE